MCERARGGRTRVRREVAKFVEVVLLARWGDADDAIPCNSTIVAVIESFTTLEQQGCTGTCQRIPVDAPRPRLYHLFLLFHHPANSTRALKK